MQKKHLSRITISGIIKSNATQHDYMTGSKYFFIIAAQYADKVITEDDLQALSPEVIAAVKLIAGE